MKIFNLLLPIMTLLTFILGCGGTEPAAPKEWKNAKPLTEKLDHPNALANDGKFIYFVTGGTVASQNEGTNNVMKMPIEGGTPTILFKGAEIIPDSNQIALDENYVYFSANGLRRIPKNGGEATLLTKAFIAWEIVVDNENVYWMPYVGEGMPPAPIYSVSKLGGAPKTLTDPRPSANGLCIDDKNIYWTQTDGVYKFGKQSGVVEKVYAMPSNGEIAGDLKSDADNFYFLQIKSRNLLKIAKTGGEPKVLAKNVVKFWVGEQEIIFSRRINSLETSLVKIGKSGEGENIIDSGGFLSDLTVGKEKIYLSNIVKFFELNK